MSGGRHAVGRLYRALPVAIPAVAVALICFLSGPERFDAVDGAEFAVAGRNMDIAHPPGYPLLLLLVRSTGTVTGYSYAGLRLLSCLLAALAYPVLRKAFISLGAGSAGSLAGPFLFLCLPPVLSQTCVLEVHSLAILLAAWAIAARNSPAGPYLFSLAVFGGHPTSAVLLPLAIPRRIRPALLLTMLVPLTLWLYVPIRAAAASVAHYTRPASPGHLLGYLGLYSGRLGAPTFQGFLAVFESMGVVVTCSFGLLAAAGYRSLRRALPAAVLAALFLSVYRADDIDSMAWLLLLPLSLMAARGFGSLWSRGLSGRAAASVLLAVSCAWGVDRAGRSGDDAAWLCSRDMLASTGWRSVYVTVAHDTYYLAYLTGTDDRRPDVVPADAYGNYFDLRLEGPLPARIGGRPVYSTRAWDEPELQLDGLLFGPGGQEPEWGSFRIFGFTEDVHDRRTRDLVAEAWLRRALQQEAGEARDSLGAVALDWAATGTTRERIVGLLENYGR